MFANPGNQIKCLARVLFWVLGSVFSLLTIIGLIILMLSDSSVSVVATCISLVIPAVILVWVSLWIFSLLLYGFGELIENTTQLKEITQLIEVNTQEEEK